MFVQHQQQVVQAVERAKQVTMAELNAIIGVSDHRSLVHTDRVLLMEYKCTSWDWADDLVRLVLTE